MSKTKALICGSILGQLILAVTGYSTWEHSQIQAFIMGGDCLPPKPLAATIVFGLKTTVGFGDTLTKFTIQVKAKRARKQPRKLTSISAKPCFQPPLAWGLREGLILPGDFQ